MAENELIEELKTKLKDTDKHREYTQSAQNKLINKSNDFNEFIKDFNNIDQFQKNTYLDSYVKIQKLSTRIDDSNTSISKIREKLKFVVNKLNKNKIDINLNE